MTPQIKTPSQIDQSDIADQALHIMLETFTFLVAHKTTVYYPISVGCCLELHVAITFHQLTLSFFTKYTMLFDVHTNYLCSLSRKPRTQLNL
jgi:hypothetical protein